MLGIAISAIVVTFVAIGIGLSATGLTAQLAIIIAMATGAIAIAAAIGNWLGAQENPHRLRHHR